MFIKLSNGHIVNTLQITDIKPLGNKVIDGFYRPYALYTTKEYTEITREDYETLEKLVDTNVFPHSKFY